MKISTVTERGYEATVAFEDGSCIATFKILIEKYGLSPNADISAAVYGELEEETDFYRLAFKYRKHLSDRLIAAKNADDYLKRSGCDEKTREKLIAFFTDRGYLNDEAFAESYCAHFDGKKSRARIAWELEEKGISAEVTEKYLRSDDTESALNAAERWISVSGRLFTIKELPRLARHLAGKGYDEYVIEGVLSEIKSKHGIADSDYC